MDIMAAVNSLGSDYVSKVTQAMKEGTGINSTSQASSDDSFDAIYQSVSGLLESTNSYIQQAQSAEVAFALGEMSNTHELGVYQQEANIALQYTVAIRDKALDAYKEIMNMSI